MRKEPATFRRPPERRDLIGQRIAGGGTNAPVVVSLVLLALSFVFTLTGCQWVRPTPVLPSEHEIRRGPLRVHCDFELPQRNRLVANLGDLHKNVTQRLQLPPSDREVHVYLFEKRRQFQKYIAHAHPSFPDRRAFFVREGDSLMVYAHWGERVVEDLQHEVTHAYLNASAESIPLWLDEGLAEFFERPVDDDGFHPAHVQLLRERWLDGSWQPNLRRLEGLASSGQMQLVDYAEAWLWVHWMLKQDVVQYQHLCDYLNASAEHRQLHPLSESIPGGDAIQVAITRHLEQLIERMSAESGKVN